MGRIVGKFSALVGLVHTWFWVRRYGVYTHEVPEHPDSIVVGTGSVKLVLIASVTTSSVGFYCCVVTDGSYW